MHADCTAVAVAAPPPQVAGEVGGFMDALKDASRGNINTLASFLMGSSNLIQVGPACCLVLGSQ